MKAITKKRVASLLAVTVSFAAGASVASAQFIDPLNVTTLEDLLVIILNTVVTIMFPIIVLMIVYTGFLFVSAQGNPTKLASARQALKWTLIGALVVLGAKALSLAIAATIKTL